MSKEDFKFEDSAEFASYCDNHELGIPASMKSEFFIPTRNSLASGKHACDDQDQDYCVYLAGNSLGLQPRKARTYIEQELSDWAAYGVEGHFQGEFPWMPYHETLTEMSARLVGARPSEVVVMNSLTTNLHLMMVSFYKPDKKRFRIAIESDAFPSDKYAVASQAAFHGYDPEHAVHELRPRDDEHVLRTEDILDFLDREGESLSLLLIGQVNYLTGQAFEIPLLVEKAHAMGVVVGLNLAHGAGNLLLSLHDWNVDFAVWCSYKYLNSGPGSLAGCFVHEKYAEAFDLPRFAGWWGHDKESRFRMESKFKPIPGAEGWQLSNPPIFQMAALRASLEIFDRVGMRELRARGDRLTAFLEFLIDGIPGDFCRIITPRKPNQRGSQLSLVFKGDSRKLLAAFKQEGVICDFREPNIIRAAPTALYNTFSDVYKFVEIVRKFAKS